MREYLGMVVIRSHPSPQPLGKIAEPWQWRRLYEPIIPAFEFLASSPPERQARPYNGAHSFWFTLPRGSDKTSTIARCCNFLLSCGRGRVPLKISVAARDKKQAKLVRDAMVTEKLLNPWFGNLLEIDNYAAKGPGGELIILSADAGSAYGGSSDLVVMDEVTHWDSIELWTALKSETIKVPHCMTVVLSNAGYHGTWQHEAIERAKGDPDWHVYDEVGYKAGWVRPAKLAAERDDCIRTTGSTMEADRLFDNIWVSSRMGSVFSPRDISAIFDPSAITIDVAA